MVFQAIKSSLHHHHHHHHHFPMEISRTKSSAAADARTLSEEIVTIRPGRKTGDPSIVTVNCPDKLGLACDLARVIFEFGLNVVRADFSTDGKWCLLLFWICPRVAAAHTIKWSTLKRHLVAACPSSSLLWLPAIATTKKEEAIYLLQTDSADRPGLLNDLALALWDLELVIHRLNVMTSPDGSAINLFFISDRRTSLHTKRRQEDVRDYMTQILGVPSVCELRPECKDDVSEEVANHLPPSILGSLFREVATEEDPKVSKLSLTIDNSLSPGHTLIQIVFSSQKCLLYDCLRVLKDLHIQVAYGRLSTSPNGVGDFDLFITEEDGGKLADPNKQKILLACLNSDLCNPVRVSVVNRGPDTELLVATLVEGNGRGRPRVLMDVTLVVKMLELCIFKADIGSFSHGGRQWQLYRFLLADLPGSALLTNSRMRSQIAERVKNVLVS